MGDPLVVTTPYGIHFLFTGKKHVLAWGENLGRRKKIRICTGNITWWEGLSSPTSLKALLVFCLITFKLSNYAYRKPTPKHDLV
jgi:hypothetical protein